MATTQYIGARYVPKFFDNPSDHSTQWVDTVEYEPLTIVTNAGYSYTSKQYVPRGIAITNAEYWALTGNFNGQVAQYVEQVQQLAEQVNGFSDDLEEAIDDITTGYTSADAALQASVNSQMQTLQTTVNGQLEDLEETVNESISELQDDTALATILAGKYMTISGDSLVRGQNLSISQAFPALIEADYNCTFDNRAVNGRAISNYGGATNSIVGTIDADITNAITRAGGADKVFAFIVQGGANDWNNDVPMGPRSYNNVDTSTFWGAMNYVYRQIATRLTKCRIMFMTTPLRYGSANNAGLREVDYAKVMLDFCRYMSIPCFDFVSDSGINLYNPGGIFNWADAGAAAGGDPSHHYSAAAYEFLAPKIAAWIAAGGYNTTQGNYIGTITSLSAPTGENYNISQYREIQFVGGYKIIAYRIDGVTANPQNRAGDGMYYTDTYEFKFPSDTVIGSVPIINVTATAYNETVTNYFAMEGVTPSGGTSFKGRFFSPTTGNRGVQLNVMILCNQ